MLLLLGFMLESCPLMESAGAGLVAASPPDPVQVLGLVPVLGCSASALKSCQSPE